MTRYQISESFGIKCPCCDVSAYVKAHVHTHAESASIERGVVSDSKLFFGVDEGEKKVGTVTGNMACMFPEHVRLIFRAVDILWKHYWPRARRFI